jgi:glutaredoxin
MNKFKRYSINTALAVLCVVSAIAFGKFLAHTVVKYKSHITRGDFSAHVVNQRFPVTLYGTTTCKYCIATRAYLKSAGIEFNDVIIDTSKDAEKRFMALGKTAVPVLVTATGLVEGYSTGDFEELIKNVKSK